MLFLHSKPLVKRYFTLLEVLIGMTLAIVLLSTLSYFYQQVEWLNTEAERAQKESFQMRYVENRLAKIMPQTFSEREMKKYFYFYTSQAEGLLKSPSLLFTYYNGVKLDSPFSNEVLGRLYLDEQKKQLCMATWPSPKRWKLGEAPPMSKEVLMENVESLAFEFYVAPDRDRSKVIDKKSTAADRKKEEQEDKSKDQKDPKVKPGEKSTSRERAADQFKKIQDQAQTKEDSNPAAAEQELIQEEQLQPKGPWSLEWSHDYHYLPAMIKIRIKRQLKDKLEEITFAFPFSYSQKVIVYEENK